MKVIFAGTPEFAAQALAAIIAAGHEVMLVMTQPDRPAGRGMKHQASAVKQLALRHDLPIYQPGKLKDPATHEAIRAAQADIMVVAAYGLILPQAVLDLPRHGCLNIHASLLPRWRGAAPIQRAIEAGDNETGITIMQMDAGLDTGPMLLKKSQLIAANETAATLHDKLAALGANAIVEALGRYSELMPVVQPTAGITYAHKIDKTEAAIDWRNTATMIERKIRAFNPFPASTATLRKTPIKFWQAVVTDGNAAPGSVLSADATGIVVATGTGAIRVTQLQRPGGKRLAAGEFLQGFPVAAGECFDASH